MPIRPAIVLCLALRLSFKQQEPSSSADGFFEPVCRDSFEQYGENSVSNKGQLLQDPFLNALRREHVPVSIYLVNGIKLQGQIESFDQYVVLLRNTITQMVYKHAISTIVPGRAIQFSGSSEEGDAGL